MFPSILGPVYAMDLHTANEIISEGVDHDADGAAEDALHPPDANLEDATPAAVKGWEPRGNHAMDSQQRVRAVVTGKVRALRFPAAPSIDALSVRVGHPSAVVEDLQTVYRLVQKICARQPWLDAAQRQQGDKKARDWQFDAQRGTMRPVELGSSFSHRLVNAALGLYSAATLEFCTSAEVNKKQALPVPIAWENRDK